ncbi:MAG: MBL fold metallo-hydrolase [Chloroflexota bacterium]|nr:MBL fold metallo-hydrolase [Chloroflexota bacterium]
MIDRIRWQGRGSFAIDGDPFIQIAPWRVVKHESPPDVILIGHEHYDHCSPADVEKIRAERTVIIGNDSVARVIDGAVVLREWQSISVDRANIKAIPAYSPSDPRHPPEAGGLGFLISLDYFDIYYVGDSELIPAMTHLRPDIVLLPIDGYGRLSVDQALKLVDMLQPRWAIPYNWGGAGEEATQLDAQSFQRRVTGATEALLLPISP